MSAIQIVILVGSILIALAIVLAVLIVWLRRKSSAARTRLSAELAIEPPIRGPEAGVYRGSTGSYPQVAGNGQIALTQRRLIFRKAVGVGVDVPLAAINGVRTAKSFNRSVVGGRIHLVVQTRAGEVAYFVSNTEEWADSTVRSGSRSPRTHTCAASPSSPVTWSLSPINDY